MRLDLVADEVQGLAHFDTKSLGFIAAGDGTAVIVRQHDDGHVLQRRVEDPLGADVKVRAVADRDGPRHPRSYRRTTPR